MKRFTQISLTFLFLFLFLTGCAAYKAEPKEAITIEHTGPNLTVHFMDVGQGAAALLESDGKFLLYDGGPGDASSKVVAYLQNQGVQIIDICVASHYDADHLSGIVGALHAFSVERMIAPKRESEGRVYASFCQIIGEKGLTVESPEVGTEIPFGSCTVTVLAPVMEYEADNDNSVVIRVDCGETSFLFGGDAERESEADMIAAGLPLDVDVYAVSHHGSSSSSSREFMAAMSPKVAVISCGKENPYGHPHQETMNVLRLAGCDIYRTDTKGDIVAYSDGAAITWNVSPDEKGSGNNEALVSGPDYVLNQKSKRFHLPTCGAVSTIKEENRKDYTGDRQALVEAGYQPCGTCKP